jgi:uncharacterized alpha-E superfamily protein
MISRVADSCFWIARYLERVDTMARLLGVSAEFHLDSGGDDIEHWKPLVIVAGAEGDFVERVGADLIDDAERVQEYLTWDREQLVSIRSSLGAARENARIIRDVLSLEMWEQINDLWLWMNERKTRKLYDRDRDSFYDTLSKQCMLFHGIAYSTMLHEEPFVFMKLGRAVERVGQTARILDVKYHSLGDTPRERETTDDAAVWLSILRSCSAFEPFFKRAANSLTGPQVLGFLLFEETFPRSVLHNLDRARGLMMRGLIRDAKDMQRRSWQLLERFRGELLQMDIEDVLGVGIHKVLTWIVDSQTELCAAIHTDYLDPAVGPSPASSASMPSLQSQSQG